MPNYINQMVDSGQALRGSVDTLHNMEVIRNNREDRAQRLRISEQQQKQLAQEAYIKQIQVPLQFQQLKSKHMSQIANQLRGLPPELRAVRYKDLVEKIAPEPIVVHPQLGPLGVSKNDGYITADEFAKLPEDKQNRYLELIAFDTGQIAELDLQNMKGFQKAEQIVLEHDKKRDEILFGEASKSRLDSAARAGAEDLEKLRQRNRLEIEEKKGGNSEVVRSSQGIYTYGGRGNTAQPLLSESGEHLKSPTADPTLAGQKIESQERAKVKVGKEKAFPKIRNKIASQNRQWALLDDKISEALSGIAWNTVGYGSWLDVLPESDAKNVKETFETIKANIGFDKIQDIRDNSPTGGALGPVSDFENRLTQAVQGSLDTTQSAEQLRKNLEIIQGNLRGLRQYTNNAYLEDFGKFGAKRATKEAIEYLKKNPSVRDQFLNFYGYLP